MPLTKTSVSWSFTNLPTLNTTYPFSGATYGNVMPVMATPVSGGPHCEKFPPAVPAPPPSPGPQFRKDCWLPQKPNSSRWLRRGQRFFRNWGLGEDFAGEYNAPGLPGITGSAGTLLGDADGAFFRQTLYPPERDYPHGVTLCFSVGMDASRCSPIYGRETTVMPPSINQPAILYLGRPA